MKIETEILDKVMVLLARVRNGTISLDGVERGLEVISNDLRQLRNRPAPCCGAPEQGKALKSAYFLRADID